MKNLILVVLLFVVSAFNAFADSPITSTGFSNAYEDVKIIKKAGEADGILNKKLMKYLASEKKPLHIKLALINKISWKFEGKENAQMYLEYLADKRGLECCADAFWEKLSGDDLICVAYLKAMDNYFDVTHAAELAKLAMKKNKNNYSTQVVGALILAQAAFDHSWCDVFKLTDRVRQDESLEQDMREGAVEIIFEYMDLYRDSCKD